MDMSVSEMDKAVLIIRDLAKSYEEKSREFGRIFDLESFDFEKVRELEARCNILTDQFRILQQRLIGSLDGDDLDDFVKVSKIYDELRLLCFIAVDFLKQKTVEC